HRARAWQRTAAPAGHLVFVLLRRRCDQPVSDRLLARQLAPAAHRFGLLARCAIRRLLIETPPLHLAEYAFPLHLFLEDAKSLVDIVVADENVQIFYSGLDCSVAAKCFAAMLRTPGTLSVSTVSAWTACKQRCQC